MKLAGVVVLYNPDSSVLDNINTYIDDLDVLYAIDNSDEDNSCIFKNKKIIYLPNYENLGIAEALNIAVDKAMSEGFNYLLTMDQDSAFNGADLKLLKSYYDQHGNEKIAIVSPFHNTVRANGYIPKGIDEPIIVMTSGNIIDLSICKKVGGFDKDLFIDCVDFDYCLKIIQAGYNIKQVNAVVLEHELGETIKKEMFGKMFFVDNHNYIRRYYIVRNRHYIYDRFKDDFKDYCEAEIKCTRSEVVKIILFEKDKFRKLRYMYRGYRDYQKGRRGRFDG